MSFDSAVAVAMRLFQTKMEYFNSHKRSNDDVFRLWISPTIEDEVVAKIRELGYSATKHEREYESWWEFTVTTSMCTTL